MHMLTLRLGNCYSVQHLQTVIIPFSFQNCEDQDVRNNNFVVCYGCETWSVMLTSVKEVFGVIVASMKDKGVCSLLG